MVFINHIKELVGFGTSNTISSLIYALFWLFLASILVKSEYGELGFLMSIASVGTAFSLLGLRATVVVYESKNENIFYTSFLLVLISSSIIAVITYFLTNNLVVSLLIVGMASFAIVQSGLIGKQLYYKFGINLLIRSSLTVATALIFYQFWDLYGILLGYFVATLISLKDLRYLSKHHEVDFKKLRSKINFMLNTYGTRLGDVFFRWGDKMIIGALFGFSTLGSYHFAAQYFLLLDTLPRAIHQYLIPKESKGEKNKQIKLFSVAITSVIAIISFFSIPYGVNVILPEYQESILPMQILSISLIPISISMIQQSEFLGKENSRIVLVGSISQSVLYLTLVFLLGNVYGIFGIAFGFLIAAIFRTIFNLINKNSTYL